MNIVSYFLGLRDRDNGVELKLRLKAVSKERPRKGRSGHMYTPKKTRDFEKKVAEMASTLSAPPYTCPVTVEIVVTEPIPKSYKGVKRLAAKHNLITPPRGDLDNKVKAVTDGLNGIVYIDDVQINTMKLSKCYGEEHSIYIKVYRSGLSANELEKYRLGYDDTDRGAEMG